MIEKRSQSCNAVAIAWINHILKKVAELGK